MGRKKKRPPPSPFSRIFCYYCDRNFTDEQTLLSHQREKHLRCPTCYKRMLSVPSMTIHAAQMHNVTLTAVPNAIPSRSNIAIDVLGMKGIPDSYYASLTQQAMQPPSKLPKTASDRNARHSQQNPQDFLSPSTHPIHPQYQHHPHPYHTYASASHVTPYQYHHHQPPHHHTHPSAYPHQPSASVSEHPHLQRQHPTLHTNHAPSRHPSPYYPYARPHPSAPVLHPPQTPRPTSAISVQTRVTNPHQSPPAVTASQYHSKQAYGPVKPPNRAQTATASSPATLPHTNPQDSQQLPTSTPTPKASTPDIKVVFDRLDLSMEELRAQLPRYKVV